MKKILVTGANGFIGRNLIESLHDKYELIPVSHTDVDLLDMRQVERLFCKENIDVVIHAATQGTLGRDKYYEEIMFKNNLKMFFNLERCKSQYGKMLILGSGAEYDKGRELIQVEESQFGESIPCDSYGLSKYIMSKAILDTDNIYNLRLFGIYGKYENYYRFISNMICKALAGKEISIHQNVKFDYLYIKDFCKLIPWFIDNRPIYKDYNVCTGEGIAILDILKEIYYQLGIEDEILVDMDGWNKEYTGSNARMLAEIGKIQFTPIEQAISEMVEYYTNSTFELNGDY